MRNFKPKVKRKRKAKLERLADKEIRRRLVRQAARQEERQVEVRALAAERNRAMMEESVTVHSL